VGKELVIRVDDRTGSAELIKYFQPYGVKVEKSRLEYGDFDFIGHGPKGECAVVFERKRIEDLVQSMESGRLSGHQLPGMALQYDYAYLLIEGIWRPGDDGQLQINNGQWISRRMHTRAISNYVMGLALRAGLIPWRTGTQHETVSFIVDQYRMWTEKQWLEHRAHDAIYAPADAAQGFRLSLMPRKVSLTEKVAMQLPGVQDKAKYVADAFGSVITLATANVDDWAGVPWKTRKGQKRVLGEVTAKKIVKAIREKS
jgi:ERCC4-type nuclease